MCGLAVCELLEWSVEAKFDVFDDVVVGGDVFVAVWLLLGGDVVVDVVAVVGVELDCCDCATAAAADVDVVGVCCD